MKSREKSRGHWASSDVMDNDVTIDDVIFNRLIS